MEFKIIGPLTLRQFLYCVPAVAVIYYTYNNFALKYSIALAIGLLVFLVVDFINHPAPIINEEYLKVKRASYDNLEDFKRWLQGSMANIHSQISERESNGIKPDPEYAQKLKLLEDAWKNMK